jgi:hypothetical protein
LVGLLELANALFAVGLERVHPACRKTSVIGRVDQQGLLPGDAPPPEDGPRDRQLSPLSEALGRIGSARAAEGLARALADSSLLVCRAARGALVAIGYEAVPALRIASRSADSGIRWQALSVLRRIGGAALGPAAALRALEDPDWRVRNEAEAALARRPVVPPSGTETEERPDFRSPPTTADGRELVIILTREGHWGVADAGAPDSERREGQRHVDAHHFLSLARTGLHRPDELDRTVTIPVTPSRRSPSSASPEAFRRTGPRPPMAICRGIGLSSSSRGSRGSTLRTLEETESAFRGWLHEVPTTPFTR